MYSWPQRKPLCIWLNVLHEEIFWIISLRIMSNESCSSEIHAPIFSPVYLAWYKQQQQTHISTELQYWFIVVKARDGTGSLIPPPLPLSLALSFKAILNPQWVEIKRTSNAAAVQMTVKCCGKSSSQTVSVTDSVLLWLCVCVCHQAGWVVDQECKMRRSHT